MRPLVELLYRRHAGEMTATLTRMLDGVKHLARLGGDLDRIADGLHDVLL